MRSFRQPETVTLAITGASGAILSREALKLLDSDDRVRTINLVASEHALRVIAEELGISGRNDLVERMLERASAKVKVQSNADIGANIASGSYPTDAMIVLPCSMGTLSKIANGLADQLIERAADVCLKEQRPLVLCVRETPLNKIHIRNLSLAADAGATIFPVVPAFYNDPKSIEEVVREYVSRVLAHIGLPQPDAYQWLGRARSK
jgi:4-hydroxy-3-polyprenylbenzoate decarboxylase